MDIIKIKNLEVFARHGVLPEENVLGQKFIVTASLYTDLRRAGKTDSLEHSVDYGAVCRDIKLFMEQNTFKLIEAAGEKLAEKLLIKYPAVKNIRLEIKKPWAPVNSHLETVSVRIERGRHTAYIALGSNIGDREAHLNFAVEELKLAQGNSVTNISPFVNTAPYGYTEQDEFLNGCLELETLLTPFELLELLNEIEQKAGRERTVRWGPRTLDLDIIFFDDMILSSPILQIPHTQMHKRDFVLKPLCEIAPWVMHPVLKKTAAELLEALTNPPVHSDKNTHISVYSTELI